MYAPFLERTRVIGTLKAIGASKLMIVRLVLSETMLLCLAGLVAGAALSFVVKEALHAVYPSLPIQMTALWIARFA